MKNLLIILTVITTITLNTTHVAAQPATPKLPVVPMIHKSCAKEIIVQPSETNVLYRCNDMDKTGVWAVFTADLDGKLRSLRVVMGDMTVYQWEVINGWYTNGSPVFADGENGVHLDNKCNIDRKAWVRFYNRNLRLPPIKVE